MKENMLVTLLIGLLFWTFIWYLGGQPEQLTSWWVVTFLIGYFPGLYMADYYLNLYTNEPIYRR